MTTIAGLRLRGGVFGALAIAVALAFASAGARPARAQTAVPVPATPALPAPTQVPPTDVPPPTAAPPQPSSTEVPTALPTPTPPAPAAPPQPPPAETPTDLTPPGTPPPIPLRTPRPTRTPRAVTPTATPPSAASFRMTLASEPLAPRRGEPVTLVVGLTNQSPFAVGHLLVEVVPPSGAQVEEAAPLTGTVERDGPVLHWLIPDLATKATTRLSIRAVLLQADAALELCATLLSSGAPVEQCLALEPPAATGLESPTEGEVPALGADVQPPSRLGGDVVRLALFVLGLVLLGLWAGTAVRSRRLLAERGAGDPLIDLGESVGVGSEVETPGVAGDDLE